jgi:hypothetical protein
MRFLLPGCALLPVLRHTFRDDPLPGGQEGALPALPGRIVLSTATVAWEAEVGGRLSAGDHLQFMPGGDHGVTSVLNDAYDA